MKSISYNVKYLLFIVIMFCAIFTPDFFSFSIRYLLVIVCGGYLLWDLIKTRKGNNILNEAYALKCFIPFLSFFVLSQLTWSIIDSSNSNIHISTLIHTFISFIGAFIMSGFIKNVGNKLNLNYSKFLNVIFVVMIIQFACVLLALTVPSVRHFFNSLIIKNSYSERLAQLADASNRGFTDRSYGLSNNLFDSFGYITAVLILLLYNKGLNEKNNRFIILSLAMVIMPIVNARTGVLLFVVGFIVVNLFCFNVKNIFKLLLIIIISLIVLSQVIKLLPEAMIEWLSSGMDDILALFSGSKDEGVFSEILGSDLVFPNSIILGAGGSPASFNYKGIDNGYVNCLWNFGLIGTILLFIGYISLFRQVYNKDNSKYYKSISTLLATVFFVYLIKIYPIDNFGINTILFGIPSIILAENNENTDKQLQSRGEGYI